VRVSSHSPPGIFKYLPPPRDPSYSLTRARALRARRANCSGCSMDLDVVAIHAGLRGYVTAL
jgi:hypothetical protein